MSLECDPIEEKRLSPDRADEFQPSAIDSEIWAIYEEKKELIRATAERIASGLDRYRQTVIEVAELPWSLQP